jgi:hypothetical protein
MLDDVGESDLTLFFLQGAMTPKLKPGDRNE